MHKFAFVLVGLALAAAPCVRAANLFGANFNNGPVVISTNDSSIVDTITHVAENADALLTPQALMAPFNATVTYMGVPHAVLLEPKFTKTLLSLRMRSVGFDETFTGRTAKEVQDKLEDFLEANGLEIIKRFSAASAFQSAFAITDGNPAATTASAARTMFYTQGLPPLFDDASTRKGVGSFSISRGALEANIAGENYRGEQVKADANLFSWRVNDRLRLEMPVTAEFTDIEGTEVYGGGATLAAPITIFSPTAARPFGWRLVPVLGANGRVSFDAVAGGISWHTGVVSVVDWRLSDRFTLSLINQATYHGAVPVDLGDYTLEQDIEQTILKNGVCLTAALTPNVHANLYVVDTRFLHRASIPSYDTVGTSVEMRAGKHLSAGVGVEGDFAKNYESVLARVHFRWRW